MDELGAKMNGKIGADCDEERDDPDPNKWKIFKHFLTKNRFEAAESDQEILSIKKFIDWEFKKYCPKGMEKF